MENKLNLLKNEYQSIKVPDYLVENGWDDLKLKLDSQQNKLHLANFSKMFLYPSFAFLALAIIATTTITANPGDKLYPLKLKAGAAAAATLDTLQEKFTNKQKVEVGNMTQNKPEESTKDAEIAPEKNMEPEGDNNRKNNDIPNSQPPLQEGKIKGKKINENNANQQENQSDKNRQDSSKPTPKTQH